ncbi:LysR family transcriptional regulator [Vibrio sp. 10N.261.55.A7]|uniref:LysR family transcriptional regulator n=1 Tax=Vibrio sp. 10N.261.55.A7 TaxID=1880851 RepID=UPI000C819685|nr:LysR family transcriptional regulator [Vibrio sp. 10N.261.55.A7]PMK02158.1 hypothetical protein BCU12_18670 [Vibrio sp. 10N.261.55.A7]
MNFSLDQLTAFVMAVEHGSFKLAAVKLGKHATTVSQQVAALEIDIGLPLFDRKVRKLLLTEQGRNLYQYARSVLTEASRFSDKIDSLCANQPTDFRLAIGTTIRDRQLIRCAKAVVSAFPTINLQILSGDPHQIIEWVKKEEADMGVISTLFQHYPGLTAVPLFNFQLVQIAPPAWVGSDRMISEDKARILPQIVYQHISVSENLQGHILSNHHYTAQNLADLIEMVSLGLGWAIVPRYQVDNHLEQGDVVEFSSIGSKTVNWYAELLYRAETQLNPAMALFIKEALTLSDR